MPPWVRITTAYRSLLTKPVELNADWPAALSPPQPCFTPAPVLALGMPKNW